jgi:hypothetical protein
MLFFTISAVNPNRLTDVVMPKGMDSDRHLNHPVLVAALRKLVDGK